MALRRSAYAADFLLSGFGWCHLAEHEAAAAVADGRLLPLRFVEAPGGRIPIHAVHRRDGRLGPAARALLADLEAEGRAIAADRPSVPIA